MTRLAFALLALLSLGATCPAPGQIPAVAGGHSLSLDVSPVSSGGRVQDQRRTQTGKRGRGRSSSETRVTHASEAVQISVRNFGALPDNARVEWYFLAEPVPGAAGTSAGGQEFVFDRGSQDVALGAGGTQSLTAESKDLTSSVKTGSQRRRNRLTAGKPQASGSALRGWVVRVVADGKVVAARGSRQAYEDLARDDARFAELLGHFTPASDGLKGRTKAARGQRRAAGA